MSIARRPAKCSSACLRCAAQNRPPVQRWSMPPCSRRTALPQTGHCARHAEVGHVASRTAGTRPTTSGITSPARRTITVSPTRTPLRRSSNRLCSVALLTVVPPTKTGSSLATGVSLPVRPTWISIALQPRHLLLRRVLVRHRPARLAGDEAQLLLQRDGVDLVDHAVDVEGQRVAPGPDRCVEGHQPGRALHHPPIGAHRQAEGGERVERARCAWPAAPSPALRPGRRRRSSARLSRQRAGSSWRTAPAAVLRGLMKVLPPCSRWRSFRRSKSSRRM